MKKLLFLLLLTLAIRPVAAQTAWQIDPTHSNVMFTVSHLIVSEVTGYFKDFDARIVTSRDDFSDAVGTMTIKAASINTDNEKRDNHLRSEDFFFADKYPEISFSSKSFQKIGDNHYKITGGLTMRGVTKPVELDAVTKGEIRDPWGNTRSGWKVTGRVDRMAYGLTWNALMETGGAVVGHDVELTVQAEFLKKK